MQRADVVELWPIHDTGKVEVEANFNVLLRQVVLVDEHLTNLVGGVRVFALLRVVSLKQKAVVAVYSCSFGVLKESGR